MAEQRDALTELVQQHVGTHTDPDKMSIVAFCERAYDSEYQYRPSNGLIGKILRGESYKVTPQLVGAIAAGLRLPRDVVAAAAHFQLIGYATTELKRGAPARVLHLLDSGPGEREQTIAERWAAEERARQ